MSPLNYNQCSVVIEVCRYITDGAAHSVDSNELAFKLAAKGAFRQVLCDAVIECILKSTICC